MRQYINSLQKRGRLFFTTQEAFTTLKISKENAISSINYFKKKGELVSPLRGFHIILPVKDRKRGSLQPQDMVVLGMKHLGAPYYTGLLSAASYHGATHQATQVFQVITNIRIRKPWIIGRVNIEFLYKKNIEASYTEEKVVSNGMLKISTAEQTAKDIMIYYDKSGGINHQATVLSELIEAIDISKLIKIASEDNKRAWIQRLGYILSQINTADNEKRDKIVEAIYQFIERKKCNFIPLAPELTIKSMPRDKKWKIIKNTTVESDI